MEEEKIHNHKKSIRLNLSSKHLTTIKGFETFTQLQKLFLRNNRITEIKGLETLTQLQKLFLKNNRITEIKGLETLTQLQVLELTGDNKFRSKNLITEIKGLETLAHLLKLYLCCNQITDIKGLKSLTRLRILHLQYNQIAEIKGLETLTQLQVLHLNNNRITDIKGLETLIQLKKLWLWENQITEIKGLNTLKHLQGLWLFGNQITEIKGLESLKYLQILNLFGNNIAEIKGLESLTQLQELNLMDNKITEIKGLETLTQLRKLFLSDNQITEIKGLETLTHLKWLTLHNNRIVEIPMTIMMCRRLEYVDYDYNVIVNPIVSRFLDRHKHKNNIKIYNDLQNVHDSSINKSITESIYCIMQETKVNNNTTILSEIISDNILTELTKKSLLEYSNIESVHSILNITFKELLIVVWEVIKNHKNSNEIKEVLNTEIKDSLCKCFTGRLSRLINCLNGFDPRIQVKISESDEISNILIIIRNKYENDIEKQKLEVIKEMTERGYDKQTIDEWLSYLE